MKKGKTIFRCADCQKVFKAMDIEWQATVYSMPMHCPRCGGRHTLPLFADKKVYREIWNSIDENK
jgi:uncharacterized C2H2 Zn-finger protein